MDVKVFLVGAGPGDAALISVRGRELLRRADVVVYDYLANDQLLRNTMPDAERIFVGKRGFANHMSQDQVNDLLVVKARELAGRPGSGPAVVVRLKGGDPFVFGRGGEEALALRAAGIPFEVVPGVTSGIAAPACAGIPVTHRKVASSVTLVTGHEDPTRDVSGLDWRALAALAARGDTLCFYMGVHGLPLIVRRLGEEGLAGSTPVALVRWGTLPAQQTLVSTLDHVVARVTEAGFGAPAIIVVGRVVGLRDRLSWFEDAPLFGRRILVTRPRAQAPALSDRLRELGADVLELPTIRIVPPDDYGPLDGALRALGTYSWVVFTSVNGVDAFFRRLAKLGADARALAGASVAVIGPTTAGRLRGHGIVADAMPDCYESEAILDAMRAAAQNGAKPLGPGSRVLVPRAQVARDALPHLLRAAGATVDVVAAYQAAGPLEEDVLQLASALREGEVDGITFTSSSTARNLVAALGADAPGLLRGVETYSIGPVTSATLRQHGLGVTVQAERYTVEGLVAAMAASFKPDGRK
jgi:uroporphyrinogen III methyltransferase/synthase